MLTRSELEQIAKACIAIGNEVADESGFVSVHSLLTRFQASLLIRPLLVEGMLASIEPERRDDYDGSRWMVLVDSERFEVRPEDVKAERYGEALPNRFRNTIAHELVHSIAYWPEGFDIKLRSDGRKRLTQSEFVKSVERETERFSPLLLWSERAIDRLVGGKTESVRMADLLKAASDMGMSRAVLVNRLRMLDTTDSHRRLYSAALSNIAVGTGEWTLGGAAILKGWPVFSNFENGLVPRFILESEKKDGVSADSFFNDSAFALCGGASLSTIVETDVGTRAVPHVRKMKLRVEVESAGGKPASEFLYLASKVD